jgi:plasmid stabilization system protein ParE
VKLRYSSRSLRQIDRALAYVVVKSPAGAANIEGRMRALLTMLQIHPHAGAKTRLPGVRRIFLTPYPYLIDYAVGDDEILVLRFRHTARRPT